MSTKDYHKELSGGCYCGLIRYRIKGEPNKVAFCHYESCRKISGAPVTVAVMVSQEQLEFTNKQPRFFASSKQAQRGFCGKCGTPVCWTGIWHGNEQAFVYGGTLDDISRVKPDRHAFTNSRIPWLSVNNELPGYDHSSPPGIIDSEKQ